MERFFLAKIEVWLGLLLALLLCIGMIGFGATALNVEQGGNRFGVVGRVAHSVFGVVDTTLRMAKSGDAMVVARGNASDPNGWIFPQGSTGIGLDGYWLMSRYIPTEQRTVIELVRLSNTEVVHVWKPDVPTLFAGANTKVNSARTENWSNQRFRAFHPLLFDNGDLLLKDSPSPLLRVDACARRIWIQDGVMFHHSTESDGQGGFWIPSIMAPSPIPFVTDKFQDDGLAQVSADGRIEQNISVGDLLMRHGMQSLVFPPFAEANDPIHLNDIQPVLSSGPFWKEGDLFLSLRHPSMVLLYRPATDEIIWQRSGLWMAQHDVDILDDHRISIYDNRAFYRGSFGRVDGHSELAIYDFATDQVTHPFSAAMARENVVSLFEGLADVLPGGDLVVEDHKSGRILFFGADGRSLGQFVNRAEDGNVYQIGWGRYVDQALGDKALDAIAKTSCPS